MKFIIKNNFKENIYTLIRNTGYHFQDEDKEKNELNFVRPPRGYPRFHLFLKAEKENLIFNLHLDQKKPIYKGTTAHSGEYEGKIIEEEAERIKQALNCL